MPRLAYLDHNASSPIRPEAAQACVEALRLDGNPSSAHRAGRLARAAIERARSQVAALAGADPRWVTFTSGGGEANALALLGVPVDRALISAIEHPSVQKARGDAAAIPVNGDGVVEPDAVRRSLATVTGPALVSVMAANNETGVIQPLSEIAAVVRAHGGILHSDAVQAAGKIALAWIVDSADLVSLSAHKVGAPAGAGALVASPALALRPYLRGGGQERGLRAGTENLLGVVGFGAAAEAVARLAEAARLAALRDRIEHSLSDDAVVFGARVERLPNTTCLAMPGVSSEVQVMAFDLDGIAVSAGAACSSGKVSRSPVLTAMGVGADLAGSAVRVSLGWTTTEQDVDRFIDAWRRLRERTGRNALRRWVAPAGR